MNHNDTEAEESSGILFVSNLENRTHFARRDFLKAITMGTLAVTALPLLNGCAASQLKAKAPKKVKARGPATLYKKPDEQTDAVGLVREDETMDVTDYQGDWLKVKTSSGITGWIKLESVVITEYTTRMLSCGSPLPPGATCLCNCVPTYTCSCNPHSYRTCSCVPVCTCNKVPVYH